MWLMMCNLTGWTLDCKVRKIQFGAYFADSAQKVRQLAGRRGHVDLKLNPQGALSYRFGGGLEGSIVHEGQLATRGGPAPCSATYGNGELLWQKDLVLCLWEYCSAVDADQNTRITGHGLEADWENKVASSVFRLDLPHIIVSCSPS